MVVTDDTSDPNSVTLDYINFSTGSVDFSNRFLCDSCSDPIHPTVKVIPNPDWIQVAILFKRSTTDVLIIGMVDQFQTTSSVGLIEVDSFGSGSLVCMGEGVFMHSFYVLAYESGEG